MRKFLVLLLIILTISSLFLLTSCAKNADETIISSLVNNTNKMSYSTTYYSLKDNKKNKTNTWRQGMVSGNGMQGFITSGDPYSDTFIYQNMHFILPNKNTRDCPVVSDELEYVKQSIIKGEDIIDNASYDDVYTFHPGGQLRIDSKSSSNKNYIRYTNYEKSEVGVYYEDKNGAWERTSFTSMADEVAFTKISKSSINSKVNITLSFDDISTFANYGKGSEVDLKYKKIVSDNLDYISLVAHYPNYENSELKYGGYATLVYVVVINGNKEKVLLNKKTSESNYYSQDNPAIKITDADEVILIAVSDRDRNMGNIQDFDNQSDFNLLNNLYAKTKDVANKYFDNNSFNYDLALDNHLAIYTPQFNAVEIELGSQSNYDSNEKLLSKQRFKNKLNADLLERAYYSGRYAYLSCSGYATSRLYGMWTGEWNSAWGSKYTMDANVNLQTSSMNSGNMSRSYIGYTYFILRQLPDWQENAFATHGYTNCFQAPVNSDGDCSVINETCYPYPFRYWNAGASWMIQPLFETLLSYGNVEIPLSSEINLYELKQVLSLTEQPLTDEDIKAIEERGYLRLEEDILLPILIKSFNYWDQLLSEDYYTSADGDIHYEEGKNVLNEKEYFCILPSYSPENNPKNYSSPSTANCAIDIAACNDNIEMLLTVIKDLNLDIDTSQFEYVQSKLPPYLFDDTGALKEWATTKFEENNKHRHLSHLYLVWPLSQTKNDENLKNACIQAIDNRNSENEASHALIHRSLIAARLEDRESLTKALVKLMNHTIHYNSLMTNHDYDRSSGYCTDFAIGYLGIINESLLYSDSNSIEILPTIPLSGFEKGKITGLRSKCKSVVNISWELENKATVQVTSEENQTLKISCPMSNDEYSYTFKKGEMKTFEFILK